MNWDVIEGKWNDVKGKVKEEWGDMTDNEVMELNGKRDQLSGKLQQKYGHTKEQADAAVDKWAEKIAS